MTIIIDRAFARRTRRAPFTAPGPALDPSAPPGPSETPTDIKQVLDVLLRNIHDPDICRNLSSTCKAANESFRFDVICIHISFLSLHLHLATIERRFPNLQHLTIKDAPATTIMSLARDLWSELDQSMPNWFDRRYSGQSALLPVKACAVIARMRRLRVLVLPQHVGAEGAAALGAGSLENLTELHMPSSGIGILGARGVARLTSLQKLDIGYSHIGSQGARALAALTSLRVLSIPGNSVDPEAATSVISALPFLGILDVSFNSCLGSAEALEALSRLEHLTRLDAACTGLTSDGLRLLAEGASRLQICYLDVSLNEVDVLSGLVGVERPLPALETLQARGMYVGEAEGKLLAGLRKLRELRLSERSVGSAARAALAPLKERGAVVEIDRMG